MADERESLNATEQSNILNAIYDLLKTNETISTLCFEANNVDGTSVGLYSQPGAVYLSKDILGGFKGLVPFMINYRSMPKKDSTRLAMIEYLNTLSDWIVQQVYPSISDGRTIEKIEQMEVPSLSNVDDNGALTYTTTFEITYRKEV